MESKHSELQEQIILEEQADREEIESLIDNLTLFDDDLMSRVFDKNTEAVELVLQIILNREIHVEQVIAQEEMKNHETGKRTIILDIHAIDDEGEEIDIEVQGDAKGAHVRRARYHSSMLDSRMLREGQSFRELRDSYVIFIYKHDKFRKGLPVYHVERCVQEVKRFFEDGSHIIYVNGSYKGDDLLGNLIEDFHQTKAEKMHFPELASGVRYFKETEKGREIMCEAVEKYGDRRELSAKLNSVKNLMENMKLNLEQALNALGIQGEERKTIQKQLHG